MLVGMPKPWQNREKNLHFCNKKTFVVQTILFTAVSYPTCSVTLTVKHVQLWRKKIRKHINVILVQTKYTLTTSILRVYSI
jgi:hypothetical protein